MKLCRFCGAISSGIGRGRDGIFAANKHHAAGASDCLSINSIGRAAHQKIARWRATAMFFVPQNRVEVCSKGAEGGDAGVGHQNVDGRHKASAMR